MNRNTAYAFKLLRLFCPPHLLEEIEGDLIQRYKKDVQAVGEKRANRRLAWNTVRYFRLWILLRNKSRPKLNVLSMILHNLKFGFRHLHRQPLNSSIHIVGLVLGISVCLTIGLFLRHELTHDDYQDNADRIFRINSSFPGQEFSIYATPIPLANEIRQHTTGAKQVALVLPQFPSTFWIDPEKIFKLPHVAIAEPELIDILKFETLAGDLSQALKRPYTAIISESIAEQFFGKENPIGKSIKFRNEFNITVEGVYKDLPPNTNLPVNVILSYVNNDNYLNNGDTWYFGHVPWVKLQACTYVLLDEGFESRAFQRQLDRIAEKNINSSTEIDKDVKGEFLLQPLSRIHLEPEFRNPWVRPIQAKWLWLFGSIGLIVLVLACINFTNLSTAQSMIRSREFGIRKVVGAQKSQLIVQFFCETIILVTGAWIISIIMVRSLFPTINLLLGKQISFNPLSTDLFVVVAASTLLVTFAAGVYPALVATRFKPVQILKSEPTSIRGNWLRKVLVSVQLTTSMILLVVLVVITRQVEFMKNLDLGAATKSIIAVEIPDRKLGHVFVTEAMRIVGIKDISLARTQAVSDDHWWNGISATQESQTTAACAIHADSHYFDVYGLDLISGSIPSEVNDTSISSVKKVVVNENLLKTLNIGTPDEAVGKRFYWIGETEIAGVIADFNTEPLKYALSPTFIIADTSLFSLACIKMESNSNTEITIKEIETLWKTTFPNEVFNPKFQDDQIRGFYKAEDQLMYLFRIFAGIAILISCLGIWGLASFDTQHRLKEISIRKVVGASVVDILKLISMQFLRLAIISSLVALPFCYLGAGQFLDIFHYKVNVNWQSYVFPALAILTLTILTISALTIRAALTNPIKNLRGE